MTENGSELLDVRTQQIKTLAEHELVRWAEMQKILLEQQASTFKWLLASLLAINGGGLATIISNDSLTPLNKVISCGLFCAGLLFAILSGQTSQRFNTKPLLPMADMRIFWLKAAILGEYDESVEADLVAKIKSTTKNAWTVPALGWLSAALFVAASSYAGWNVAMNGQVKERAASCRWF